MFKPTLQHRGTIENQTVKLQEEKRWGFIACRDAAEAKRGELNFLLLTLLLPVCKEQKTHTEKPHTKPSQLRRRWLVRR